MNTTTYRVQPLLGLPGFFDVVEERTAYARKRPYRGAAPMSYGGCLVFTTRHRFDSQEAAEAFVWVLENVRPAAVEEMANQHFREVHARLAEKVLVLGL
jgi:hypothetical protein